MIGDVKDQIDEGEEEGENELAYLKMPNWKYYALTIGLYIVCIIGAIFIEDLAIVFDFVGAFGSCILTFTLPGTLYLLLQRNERANHSIESDKARKCNVIGSYAAIFISIINMIMVIVKIFV